MELGTVAVVLIAHSLTSIFARGLFVEHRLTGKRLDDGKIRFWEVVGAVALSFAALLPILLWQLSGAAAAILALMAAPVAGYEVMRLEAARRGEMPLTVLATVVWAIMPVAVLILAQAYVGGGPCSTMAIASWALTPAVAVIVLLLSGRWVGEPLLKRDLRRGLRFGAENLLGTGALRMSLLAVTPFLGLAAIGQIRLILGLYGPANTVLASLLTMLLTTQDADGLLRTYRRASLWTAAMMLLYASLVTWAAATPVVRDAIGLQSGALGLAIALGLQKVLTSSTVVRFAFIRRFDHTRTLQRRLAEGAAIALCMLVGARTMGMIGLEVGLVMGALVALGIWWLPAASSSDLDASKGRELCK